VSLNSQKRDLESLRLILHSGIDVMTQMPVTSEILKRLIPSFSLSMIRVNNACEPQEHYSEYFDEFSHRLFAEQGHLFSAQTDDPAAFGNLLRGTRTCGNLIHNSPEYLQGGTYQHLFKRNGIHHCLDIAVRDANGPLAILGIFREEGAVAFTADDVILSSDFYASLVHAFRAPNDLDLFEETDSAIILLDPSGGIEFATPSALAWLEDASAGTERALLMDRQALPEACRVLAKRLRAGENPMLFLPVPGGRLRLRAYGMTPFSTGELKERIAIQLQLEMNTRLRVIRALEASPLTNQLRRVALAHFDGLEPKEICASLNITQHTLKSYQKDLYARLDVNSSVELVKLLTAQSKAVTFDLNRHFPRG
jgi:hypothetical protein